MKIRHTAKFIGVVTDEPQMLRIFQDGGSFDGLHEYEPNIDDGGKARSGF